MEVGAAPGAPRDRTGSVAETGAGSGGGVACGGFGPAADAGIAAGDARAVIVDGPFGRRIGHGAGIAGVGARAGMWRGWSGAVGGAERWREGVGAYGAAGEDG